MSRQAIIQICTEFLPTIIFFAAGQLFDFMTAVYLLTFSTAISLTVSLWLLGRIPFLPLFSSIFVIISGGITILLHKPQAVILADSIYYLAIALIIVSGLASGKYFLKWLFDSSFAISDLGWKILSYRWLKLLLIAGLANEVVRHTASPEFWVDFRFIKIILIIGFALYQFRVSKRYRIPDESNKWGIRIITKAELAKKETKHIPFEAK